MIVRVLNSRYGFIIVIRVAITHEEALLKTYLLISRMIPEKGVFESMWGKSTWVSKTETTEVNYVARGV